MSGRWQRLPACSRIFPWGCLTALWVIVGCSGNSETPPPETPTTTPDALFDLDGDGYTSENGDCDDKNWTVYTGAPETPYDGVDQDCDGSDVTDVDGDGYDASQVDGPDCDDDNANTHPGAPEVADNYDNDCNGEVDDGVDDLDNDEDGYSEADGDCNDNDADIHPKAEEIAYDGIDQDCSGKDLNDVDEDGSVGGEGGPDCNDQDVNVKPGAEEVPYDGVDQDCNGSDLVDVDGDGAAGGPEGKDCDDQDPARNPGQTDLPYDGIDQNCDGTDLTDVDGDGQDATLVGGTDCNDKVPTIYSGAVEVAYDGVDQDCSGSDLTDVDGDGFSSVIVSGGTDCNDQDKSTYPGAPEYADGKDNDCDGVKDEDLDSTDNDKDGYSEATGDCDDTNVNLHPGATEVPYDGLDQDCSGTDLTDVDKDGVASTAVTGGADCNDNDKNINPNVSEIAYDGIDQDCSGSDLVDVDHDGAASIKVTGGTDCNDSDALISPTAVEVPYDGIDQDCKNGDLIDVDGDGVASTAVVGGTDCNDSNAAVSPKATEKCDSVDNDCNGKVDDGASDAFTFYTDADHDGYGDPSKSVVACTSNSSLVTNSLDCDDTTAQTYPGASEVCDGKDNNCNSKVDDGVGDVFYQDLDGDTYGNYAKIQIACSRPTGYVPDPGNGSLLDCDDKNQAIHPGATELCNSADDDCDGLIDDGVVEQTYYQDKDSDGYGNVAVTQKTCLAAPAGYASQSGDCNENDASIHPFATETCNNVDDDCDGTADEGAKTTYYQDSDGDTFGNPSNSVQACSAPTGYVSNNTDCNDASASVKPSATETCNTIDDDCDGVVDDDLKTTFYKDADGDGYGSAASPTQACAAPTGYVSNALDCNDASASVKPGATETCNSIDDDCDGNADDGVKLTWYKDGDGDGYGTSATTAQACSAPTGYVAEAGDCNDASASVKPGATETCNGVDDDCDLELDEGVKSTFYKDADGDTFGASSNSVQACSAPSGYVSNSADCNDSSASVKPTAAEVCNSIDDDCDGFADDGVSITYYRDADSDGYGTTSSTTTGCTAPSGYVSNSTDCNDSSASVKPGATETCNGVDDDCDTLIDDGAKLTYYKDADADGYGSAATSTQACSQPSGYVTNSADCNDSNASVKPGATETCNGIDDDCDGLSDDGVKVTWYKDTDGDGYGTTTTTAQACTAPSGYVSNSADCNDASASVKPGATETCNGVDDDCDTVVDDGVTSTYYKDADGDAFGTASNSVQACSAPSGYVTNNSDCNDTNANIKPSASETCNGVDDDCDATIDDGVSVTYYRDADGDTYGNPSVSTAACALPSGYVTNNTDCDDTRSSVKPGATEVCNSIDDNCNATVDEGVKITYYRDADGDTYGAAANSTQACTAPTGYVTNSTDCDDANAAVNPGASEVQNGIDDNCDGSIDTQASCKAIKAATPSAPSGVYLIDVDGSGPKAAISVYCEMTVDGGGWTVATYIRAPSQWDTAIGSNLGTVGDTTNGFASGGTLTTANPTFTERIIIYLRLIENGTDLGKQWMITYRSAGVTYSAIATNSGWSYRDSYNYSDTTVTDTCTHGCSTWRGFGMFHDYESTFGWCGTQTGDYGCRDGNNICWMPRSGGCNVGSMRCSYLTGTNEGVIYAMR